MSPQSSYTHRSKAIRRSCIDMRAQLLKARTAWDVAHNEHRAPEWERIARYLESVAQVAQHFADEARDLEKQVRR